MCIHSRINACSYMYIWDVISDEVKTPLLLSVTRVIYRHRMNKLKEYKKSSPRWRCELYFVVRRCLSDLIVISFPLSRKFFFVNLISSSDRIFSIASLYLVFFSLNAWNSACHKFADKSTTDHISMSGWHQKRKTFCGNHSHFASSGI